MTTKESTMNVALAEVLQECLSEWSVEGEALGKLQNSKAQPDIIITENTASRGVTVIETEVHPSVQGVERESKGRLGLRLKDDTEITVAIAVRIPENFKQLKQKRLREKFRSTDRLEYSVFSPQRFPESGWLSGGAFDLCNIVRATQNSPKIIDAAVKRLSNGIMAAEKIIGENARTARVLCQEDSPQTQRMAAAIITNALIFNEILSGLHEEIDPIDSDCGRSGVPTKSSIIERWDKILEINYWPIFNIAREILLGIEAGPSARMLGALIPVASDLVGMGVSQSSDLLGTIFQKLIIDRHFLATYYTRPPAAALLASLALPTGKTWDAKAAKGHTIADFSCGTGTLLSYAYKRLISLHGRYGGTVKGIHQAKIEESLIGCDIVPAAVHLTASTLAAIYPKARFSRTKFYPMPYGKTKGNKNPQVGSVELLGTHDIKPLFPTGAKLGGRSGGPGSPLVEIPDRSCDTVIMNPPFTRATNHEGKQKNSGVAVPPYAGMGTSNADQRIMSLREGELARGTCSHGNAGMAALFFAIADKKVREGGTVAMVIPASCLWGSSWEGVRRLLMDDYRNIRVVTIASPDVKKCAFSADTDMSDMLVVAEKERGCGTKSGLFAVLDGRPETPIEGLEIARAISGAGRLKTLEGGPAGGNRIRIGSSSAGTMINSTLQAEVWPVGIIRDLALAQIAFQLEQGVIWIPTGERRKIPITRLSRIAEPGLLSRDITGAGKRGPFDVIKHPNPTASYPCLWAHDAPRERAMMVSPDSELEPRHGVSARRADDAWDKYASRVHFNVNFRYNSQSLAAAYTEAPTLGGRAWPNLLFQDEKIEKAATVWLNSTLGIVSHWWCANKAQPGRGSISKAQQGMVPVIDAPGLGPGQVEAMCGIFDDMKNMDLLPINEILRDENRMEMDRRILSEALGVDPDIGLVRKKLAREPSVTGGKRIVG